MIIIWPENVYGKDPRFNMGMFMFVLYHFMQEVRYWER